MYGLQIKLAELQTRLDHTTEEIEMLEEEQSVQQTECKSIERKLQLEEDALRALDQELRVLRRNQEKIKGLKHQIE